MSKTTLDPEDLCTLSPSVPRRGRRGCCARSPPPSSAGYSSRATTPASCPSAPAPGRTGPPRRSARSGCSTRSPPGGAGLSPATSATTHAVYVCDGFLSTSILWPKNNLLVYKQASFSYVVGSLIEITSVMILFSNVQNVIQCTAQSQVRISLSCRSGCLASSQAAGLQPDCLVPIFLHPGWL